MENYITLIFWSILSYIILTLFFNLTLHAFSKLKWPWKNKKWDGKMDPIYELYYGEWDNCYKIRKYELGYRKNPNVNLLHWIFPFYELFMFYGYKLCDGSYGSFTKNDIQNIEKPLSEIWEKEYEQHKQEYEEINRVYDIKIIKINKMNSLNKEFKENYE